jgi:hypothetical protein
MKKCSTFVESRASEVQSCLLVAECSACGVGVVYHSQLEDLTEHNVSCELSAIF